MAEQIIKTAKFIGSSPDTKSCPPAHYPEYAFTGRSNVGKSSLINYLCNRKMLAKTSATPGKTLLINHFLVDEDTYLVDLPGYGYAKTSKKTRESILKMIFHYLRNREGLTCLFLLIDSRNGLLESDRTVIRWLGQARIPFVIVLTKIDKLKPIQLEKNLDALRRELLETWEELPPVFLSSARGKTGRSEILNFIRTKD